MSLARQSGGRGGGGVKNLYGMCQNLDNTAKIEFEMF